MSAPNSSGGQPDLPFARLAIAGLLAAAGGLHLAALPGHMQASAAVGTFFALTAAAQLLGAVLVATRGSSRTMVAVVVGNLAVLGLWALSRTTGLPTGGELGLREPLGVLDGLSATAEIIVVAGGLAVLRRRSRATAPQWAIRPPSAIRRPATIGRRPATWLRTFALAITWLASGGAGLALADAGHHHAGGHAHVVSSIRTPSLDQPAGPGYGDSVSGVPSLSAPSHEGAGFRGHIHDAPPHSGVSTGRQCPAGHDCADHPH